MMKQLKLWSILMLTVMTMPVMVSCGGDEEDDDNGSGVNIDGVNVINGKKLVGLEIYDEEKSSLPMNFKIEYDSKGRMSKILVEQIAYDYENNTYKPYLSGKFMECASIDYDLRVISFRWNSYSRYQKSYNYSLNKDGYISQIGTCMLNYNQDGYLTEVNQTSGISTLAYEANDLLKASVSQMSMGNMSLYYVTYNNIENEGNLFVRVKRTDDKRIYSRIDERSVYSFIAYQSGLFGKVCKSVVNVTNKNEAYALFDYDNNDKNDYSSSGKIVFHCE